MIPVFAPAVDLSCVAEIGVDQVRRIARHLKMQDLPRQTCHVHDLVQPLVFALGVHAADPESERGGLGLWLFDLAGAFIFFRSAGTPPRTVPDMRQRAALLVDSVSNGTFPARWREFTAAAVAACDAEDAGALHACEDFDDYDSIPTVPLPPFRCGGRELRKSTYLASKGELGMAWRCFQPSPAEDPRLDESKCALIGLNPQGDGRPPLTEADVADEPGHAPLQVSPQLVAKAAAGLHDIRAAGSLPEDNRILKAVAIHGGLTALTAMVNACCRDVGSDRSRDMLAGAVRAGLLQKTDPITGKCVGRRPLGMTEKLRCLVWACVNATHKTKFARHFTSPLPEDTAAWQRDIDNAESKVLACELELQAARDAGRSTAAVAALLALLGSASAALALARRPFKYVTNWCFSSKGTENLVHLVRGWRESAPRKGIIADDIKAMYQNVNRKASFDFLRKRFPALLAVYRFFYFTGAVIWFGGRKVPIVLSVLASGAVTARLGDKTSSHVLRSMVGGCQGDGGATLLCIGPYHETLSNIQRRHRSVDVTCTADDSYGRGDCEPLPDGGQPALFAWYNDKRATCEVEVGVTSVPRKTNVMTDLGDLSAAPADLPGSPNHPTHNQPVEAIKVAGAFVGLPAASSAGTLAVIKARLAPLAHLLGMRDEGNVTNVVQLQFNLTRLCACAIPNHWMRTTPPEETRDAAAYSDATIQDAFATILDCNPVADPADPVAPPLPATPAAPDACTHC